MRLDLVIRNGVQALFDRVEDSYFFGGEFREHRPLRATEEINWISGPAEGL